VTKHLLSFVAVRFLPLFPGIGLATTIFLLSWTTPTYADWVSTVTAASPLHWWRFEETDGDSADDVGSADVDGLYSGEFDLGVPGLVGTAAGFSGAGYVLIEEEDLESDWTVEAIFYADVENGATSQGLIGALTFNDPRMAIKAEQWDSTGVLGYTLFGVVDISFGADTPADFAHVVIVGSDAGVELYVEGEFIGFNATTTPLSRHVLAAGQENASGGLVDPLTGAIDELVIYDRALTAEEVEQHYAAILTPPSLVGDFNGDFMIDAADIDLLTAAIIAGSSDGIYDLDGNGSVAILDRDFLVETILGTYIGDANLDGEFSSRDFVAIFQINEYEDAIPGNSGWADGDFNGDMDFDSSDFVAAFQKGGFELGPRTAVSAVPEPTTCLGLLLTTVLIAGRRRAASVL
jgi:hypothetical protein